MLCILSSIESFVGSKAGDEEEVLIFVKAFILFPWGKGVQAFPQEKLHLIFSSF